MYSSIPIGGYGKSSCNSDKFTSIKLFILEYEKGIIGFGFGTCWCFSIYTYIEIIISPFIVEFFSDKLVLEKGKQKATCRKGQALLYIVLFPLCFII